MTTLLISLILALAAVVFSLQNTAPVTIQFLVWEYQTSLVLLILGALAVGAGLAYIASLGSHLRRTRQIHQLQDTVASQGSRIHALEGHLQDAQRSSKEPSILSQI